MIRVPILRSLKIQAMVAAFTVTPTIYSRCSLVEVAEVATITVSAMEVAAVEVTILSDSVD